MEVQYYYEVTNEDSVRIQTNHEIPFKTDSLVHRSCNNIAFGVYFWMAMILMIITAAKWYRIDLLAKFYNWHYVDGTYKCCYRTNALVMSLAFSQRCAL